MNFTSKVPKKDGYYWYKSYPTFPMTIACISTVMNIRFIEVLGDKNQTLVYVGDNKNEVWGKEIRP